ncbi:MAG: flagellar export protein FliJ [Syntrophorhabdaceae bacterium]|nr:flagellar export protein FliJ [Syntrophorhabdaceae bacterium]
MNKQLGTINKVLHLKEQLEEEIELEVRRMRDHISMLQTRLSVLEDTYMETQNKFLDKQMAGELALQEMGIYQSYLFHLHVEMEKRKAEIARALIALDARHEALVEAHKETRLVETLKERREKENAKEEMRQERKEMDSISSMLREVNK